MKFQETHLDSVFKRSRGNLQVLHLPLLQSTYGEHPIPFGYCFTVLSLIKLACPSPDPLFSPYGLLQSKGASLQIAEFPELLSKDVLGTWLR
jgi:hypothetical protein